MMGILQVVTAVALMLWYSVLPLSHYGEITYFIQRVEAVVLGRAPYVDFAFDYGPAMLALPVGIYRLFHGAVSVEVAYTAALIIHFTLGFGLLAYVVSQINTRGAFYSGHGRFPMDQPDIGLNYTRCIQYGVAFLLRRPPS